MKFNRIKNTIKALLLISCTFSGITYGMQREGSERRLIAREESREQNLITPYVNAAASLAVGRYVPEIAERVLPRVLPENYELAHALVPQALKYGAYGLGAHFLLKNACGINYSDLLKAKYLKQAATQAAKVAPHLAPLTLCHPQVAQLAADACTSLASSYISEGTLQALDKYAAPALMTAGALGTLYLVNRNIFNGQLLKKAKKVCKDIRPYLFIAPLASAYNADTVKNYVMAKVPSMIGSNLHSDIGNGVKATIYWGSLGLAAYLFATESLGLANQGYVKKQVDKLMQNCSEIGTQLSRLTKRITTVEQATTSIRLAQRDQHSALTAYAKKAAESMQSIAGILHAISLNHAQSAQAVAALQRININLKNTAQNITIIAPEISQHIAVLRVDHAKKIAEMKATIKDHGEELLTIFTQNNAAIEDKIAHIEQACLEEAVQLEQLQPKLAELLALLAVENTWCNLDQEQMATIAQMLEGSTQNIDAITKELQAMNGHVASKPAIRK